MKTVIGICITLLMWSCTAQREIEVDSGLAELVKIVPAERWREPGMKWQVWRAKGVDYYFLTTEKDNTPIGVYRWVIIPKQ